MEVLLLKDISNIGLAGQVKNVNEGYARNFLFPKRLAKKANPQEVARFQAALAKSKQIESIAGSRVAALAGQIKNLNIKVAKKMHDENKLYGSVSAEEVIDALKEKNITVNKKQIEFAKAIRTLGEHTITIKLSSKASAELNLKVVAAKE